MGLFASWIALASAGFFFVIHRLRRHFQLPRIGMVALGDMGDICSRTVYWLFFSLTGLIAKSLLDSFIVPLRAVFGENILRRRVELIASQHRLSIAEAILFQESVILAGRVFTCSSLIIIFTLIKADPVPTARILLMVFLAYGLIDFFFVRRIMRGNQVLAQSKGSNTDLG